MILESIKETKTPLKWYRAEDKVVEFLNDRGVPAIRTHVFDVLCKILGNYYAIEVKTKDSTRQRWMIYIHVPSWQFQIKFAEEFGWHRILIFCSKYAGDYVLENLNRLDEIVMKEKRRSIGLSLKQEIIRQKSSTLDEWLNLVTVPMIKKTKIH